MMIWFHKEVKEAREKEEEGNEIGDKEEGDKEAEDNESFSVDEDTRNNDKAAIRSVNFLFRYLVYPVYNVAFVLAMILSDHTDILLLSRSAVVMKFETKDLLLFVFCCQMSLSQRHSPVWLTSSKDLRHHCTLFGLRMNSTKS